MTCYKIPATISILNAIVVYARSRSIFLLSSARQSGFAGASTRSRSTSIAGAFCSNRRYHSSQTHSGEKYSLAEENKFEECWASDSWSVNPMNDPKVDDTLASLHSPAPQSYYVINRALQRAKSDEERLQVCNKLAYLVKENRTIIFRKLDTPFSIDGSSSSLSSTGTYWKILPTNETKSSDFHSPQWICSFDASNKHNSGKATASDQASQILQYVTKQSEQGWMIDSNKIEEMIDSLENHIELTLGTDCRGRTSADVALLLALAGISRESIFDSLSCVARLEMQRLQHRTSRKAKDVVHTVEKLAASGTRGRNAIDLYRCALESKTMEGSSFDLTHTAPEDFTFMSRRALMWLWRHSTRRKKPRVLEQDSKEAQFHHQAAPYSLWNVDSFENNKRPLVIDLGCGMGVSLLGLALQSKHLKLGSTRSKYYDHNFLGVDLSQISLRYGVGIAQRWSLSDRLQYIYAPADVALEKVLRDYDYAVSTILIQFPSPYRLSPDEDGNTQLPRDKKSGFMVTEKLLSLAHALLLPTNGTLVFQSNVEDVAVYVMELAKANGFKPQVSKQTTPRDTDKTRKIPQRTKLWAEMGGRRALGPEWITEPILLDGSLSETEVACLLNDNPVHRCILMPIAR